APSAKELAPLIEDLGAKEFAKREAAQKRLRGYGQTIAASMRETINGANAEQKRRLNQIIAEWNSVASRTPEEIRAIRCVHVLDRVKTPEARRLLEECACGAASAILTKEARQALKDTDKNQ